MHYQIGRLILLACLVTMPMGLNAQSSGGAYNLNRHTIDGGGGTSEGWVYVLTGTIGQPDAQRSEGGEFVLQGGFWSGPAQIVEVLFRDGFEG